MRIFDPHSQFEAVKKSATDALRDIFPVEGKKRLLKLDSVWVDDELSHTDYNGQSAIKNKEGTWGVPVYASMTLIDKDTGKPVDKEEKIKIFTLPKITDRHSYIVRGNEYQVTNQLRLKPGVYTERKQNGELKTQINLARGKNFDLAFNESSGTFTIQKVGGGQANIPLYPVLAHLGISASAMANAWGSKIEAANRLTDQRVIQKAETAFGIKTGSLKDYFSGTEISPETTKMVLGQSFSKVDGPLLLAASKNLLETHQGKREPLDRDSMVFKELWSAEDFIHTRIQKNKQNLANKINRSIDNLKRTKITQLINPSAFNATVESFFTQDDKSNTPEQTNPLEMLAGQYRVTIMGSGGIKSDHAITTKMREIHPSHYGFIDPIHSPEGNVGVNMNLPIGAVKDGKNIKMTVYTKDGKASYISPIEAHNAVIALPNQKGDRLKAMHKGKITEVMRSEVDYFTPHPGFLFAPSTNLIPFLPTDQGNRAMMASKQLEQAISLKNREAPLVQVGYSGDKSMEEILGSGMSAKSPIDGKITKVTSDAIEIKGNNGEKKKVDLYNNYVLNRKSFLHHTPVVKVGDAVKKDQLLADGNYTKNGVLALGTNLKTAYLPYGGNTFDDGIVITQSASEKLTSEHIYKKEYDIEATSLLSLSAFKSNYPNLITGENQAKLDADGVIMKGQKVKNGDIIIAALRKGVTSAKLALVGKGLSDRPRDDSLTWNLEDDGIVMDVTRSGKRVTVTIKTEEKAKIGDKLSGRHGNKGVITKIIPDAKAPYTADGKHVDVLLNPVGVISRINLGQIFESAVGKAAAAQGAPQKVYNFTGEDYLKTTKDVLKKAKISDKEELFHPETGKSMGMVHVGIPHILKLSKQSTTQYSVRQGGPGFPYDANMQPVKGGEEGSKALDQLTLYCMLSHGARANLREMSAVKGTSNDEYWKALKSGQQLPPPKAPFAYEKFMGYLKGAGVDVKKDGTKLVLAPLTDAKLKEMSSGSVSKPFFFRSKDLKPVTGGLFDPVVTGGYGGNKWAHMELHEPVVNPVFENAAKNLLGLGKKFDDIVAGKLHVNSKGEINDAGKGLTGGAAIEHLLKKIDVNQQLEDIKGKINRAKGATLDDLNKKARYLNALKVADLKPHEAYIRKLVLVIPTSYRPIYPRPDGSVVAADTNYIYQNIAILNDLMNPQKRPVMSLLPEEDKAAIRKDLYEHVKGLSGLTDMNIKGRQRNGFIAEIAGDQPKTGFFISKLISKQQDYVGRAVATPEPSLHVDELGVPEDMAWKLFEPFVIREMKNQGKTPIQAKEEIDKRTPLAKKCLEIVMNDRHVLMNRAPSLHKFSVMAFKPKIVSGKTIQVQPLINKGFGLDFDGDAVTVHVPISNEANREAEKMLPSRNLFQPGTGQLMLVPSQEAQIGLFYLSKSAQGRSLLNSQLPAKYKVTDVLDKGAVQTMLRTIAKELPANEFGKIVTMLKTEGEKHAYERGFTLGVDDVAQFGSARDSLVKSLREKLKSAKTDKERDEIGKQYLAHIDTMIDKKLKDKDNPLYDMVRSGAKGSRAQLRDIVATPLLVTGAKGKIIYRPIAKSYAEGLDVGDYWTAMFGARRGMIDRSLQSSEPGAFSKDVMATAIDNVISGVDCGTKEGITLRIDDHNALDRYTAGTQGSVEANTLVDSNVIARFKKSGASSIKVRSPLRCLMPRGTCAKCHGLDEHGRPPVVGENIGAKAGQTIAEPLMQLQMNAFHTGGTVGSGLQGYPRIKQLLQMPKIVVGAAALAPVDGTVTKITKGLGGGHDIAINGVVVHAPKGLALKVKDGDSVKAGDPLSEGAIKPQDLVKYKGMLPAQQYIVDELHKAYQNEGIGRKRVVFETIVRSLGNLTKVVKTNKDTGHLAGDIIPYTVAEHHNKNLDETVSLENAVGMALAEGRGSLRAGHVIDDKDIVYLKGMSFKEVPVKKDPIVHAPILKGLSTLPILRKDWMAALGYRHIAKNIVEGAGQGWHTDLESYHPIPAFAHGATFGQGKEGKY